MTGGRLFFLATDSAEPSGGRKFIYLLAQKARAIGYDAYVLHGERGMEYDWFDHSAETRFDTSFKRRSRLNALRTRTDDLVRSILPADPKRVTVGPGDVVVLPENRIARAGSIFAGARKIALCQNPYLLLHSDSGSPRKDPAINTGLCGFICMSEVCLDAAEFLSLGVPSHRVPLFIDPRHFFAGDGRGRRKIAYMPRRRGQEAETVIKLLRARGRLTGFEFTPISGVYERAVGDALRDASVFLSFSRDEGFGLPPAEAIACGCAVVGYSGHGGDEYFGDFGAVSVADGHLMEFVVYVERCVEAIRTGAAFTPDERRRNSEGILARYSEERTDAALASALDDLIGSP